MEAAKVSIVATRQEQQSQKNRKALPLRLANSLVGTSTMLRRMFFVCRDVTMASLWLGLQQTWDCVVWTKRTTCVNRIHLSSTHLLRHRIKLSKDVHRSDPSSVFQCSPTYMRTEQLCGKREREKDKTEKNKLFSSFFFFFLFFFFFFFSFSHICIYFCWYLARMVFLFLFFPGVARNQELVYDHIAVKWTKCICARFLKQILMVSE